MAGAEDDDEFGDASSVSLDEVTDDAAAPPPSPPPGLGRRLLASIPRTFSAAIALASSPSKHKPPPPPPPSPANSNVGLGLVLHLGPNHAAPVSAPASAPPATPSPVSSFSDAVSGFADSLHYLDAPEGDGDGEAPLASPTQDAHALQQHHGEMDASSALGKASSEQDAAAQSPQLHEESTLRHTQDQLVQHHVCVGGEPVPMEEGREKEGVAPVCAANMNCVASLGDHELEAAMEDSAVQYQDMVEQQSATHDKGTTKDCAAVGDQGTPVEQFTSGESIAVKAENVVLEMEKAVEQEGAICKQGADNDDNSVEYLPELDEDGISVRDQDKCASGQLRTTVDGNTENDQEVVDQEGAVDGTADDIAVEDQGMAVEQSAGDQSTKEEDAVDGISVRDQDKCASGQLRTTEDGNTENDQAVVDQEGAVHGTADGIAVEDQDMAVEQSAGDQSRATKEENVMEDKEKEAQQDCATEKLATIKDHRDVECKEEAKVVVLVEQIVADKPGAAKDNIAVVDQDKAVEQHTSVELGTIMDDNAVENQEVVVQGVNDETGAATDDIAFEDEDKSVEKFAGDKKSRETKDESALKENEVAHQEGTVDKPGATKDDIAVLGQDKTMEQCTVEWEATMDDHAVEDQEIVVQGVNEESSAATEGIALEDQEKLLEQSAGDYKSRDTKDENDLEENEVVHQEGTVDKPGATKDDIVVVDEYKAVEQCTGVILGATMDDNAVEDQEVMQGINEENNATTDDIALKDQEQLVEQSAGDDKSREMMDESALEENELVHQEGAVDIQGAIKEDNAVESLGEVVVLVDRGVTDKLGADKDVVAMEDQDKVVEQAVIDSGTKRNVIAFDDQEVVFKQGVIDGSGAPGSAIACEEQDNVVDLTAGDNNSMETKDENIVDESEKVVEQGARCKQDTVAKNHFTIRDHEEAVELYVSDELRAENDQNALEECKAVEQGAISEIGGTKDTAEEKQWEVKEQNNVDKWGTNCDGVAPETLKEVVQPLRHEWGATEDDLSPDMADSGGVTTISSSEVVPAMKSGGDEETGTKEKVRLCVGYPQRPGRLNCPFYMSTGRCTYGFSCHFNHPRLKAKSEVQSFTSEQGSREVMELLELNRVGLPIREGARNCTYYMRNGTCRYGKRCCFNHPEQVLDVQVYVPTGWEDNNMPSSPHSSNLPSSPLSKKSSGHATLDDTLSSSEVLPANILRMLLPPQKAPPGTEIKVQKDPNWSSASDDSDDCCSADSSGGPLCKQEHVDYPNMSGRQECPFLVRFGNCKFASTCKYYHPKGNFSSRYDSKKQSPAEELIVYPDRPDEPECPFYMKTGHCKFGAACKFHHPKDLTSSMGSPSIPKRSVTANEHHPAPRTTLQNHMNKQQQYPERPGQPDCRYYMQFGKCKFLSACIFNHPKDRLPGMPECPFYMKTGKCQFGSACEFHHPEDRCSSTAVTIEDGTDFEYDNFTKSENDVQEEERTMYPERPGAPECFHYMKHGYCKFQTNCKYHHPRGRLPKK